MAIYSIIKGAGSCVPDRVVSNADFLDSTFCDSRGDRLNGSNNKIIETFQKISGIQERRYIAEGLVTSDIGYLAAQDALSSARIDRERFDYIIVAHNHGDVRAGTNRVDIIPSLAARIKHKLGIENAATVAYDVIFGCAGWLQSVIQADIYIKSGYAQRILVIGAETLSRISDPHDRDSMLYADGAGAVILEAYESDEPVGILASLTRSDTLGLAYSLQMGRSNDLTHCADERFLKMEGRKVYEYALNTVPALMKECLDQAKRSIDEVKKVLIHQANAKMLDKMLIRFFDLYETRCIPEYIMPRTISKYGNNSCATLPILFDHLIKNKLTNHSLGQGDLVILASVGAGMNANVVVYQQPW